MNETTPKILVSIITFNPNIRALEKCIVFLRNQVSHIFIYDNNSNNKEDLQKLNNDSVSVVFNSNNLGLARNYNRAIEYGVQNKFDHLLILDQDSDFDEKLAQIYAQNISDDYVALVPLLNHVNQDYRIAYPEKCNGTSEVIKESINSGLFLNLRNLPTNLRFDEDYFIDCVDFDFFEKIKDANLKILRVNSAILNISLGNITKVGPFFLYNYSPFRLRKQAHDRIVFLRKHSFSKKAIWLFFFATFNNAKIILFEKQRFQKLQALFHGTMEGFLHKFKNV